MTAFSIPQWLAGELTNVIQLQDVSIIKAILRQVIAAMQDANSLPWAAVRGAWASSMHLIEDGRLDWQDETRWALNRLNVSQISMMNSQAVNNPGNS